MILPTKKLVDQIYQAASVKVAPKPLKWGPQMTSIKYFLKHEAIVSKQFQGGAKYALRAGHKKDIILSSRLANHPTQVAIYGWHRLNGRRIQPVSLVHNNQYADYSHGVRLLSKTILVDDIAMDLERVLADKDLHTLVSDSGPITQNPYRQAIATL